MKKQFVKQIKAGDSVDDVFVLSEKVMSQKRDGSNYLNIVLSDRTGTLKGVVWDKVETMSADVAAGDIVAIKGTVSDYRGALQIVVRDMSLLAGLDVDVSDFLPATVRNVDDMLERLKRIVQSIQCEHLKALLEAFFQDEAFIQGFKAAPAAKKMHHAYVGGLLEHTLSMAMLADKIAGHYGGINRDLLLAGVILHDIGKIEEFEYRIKIDYTDAGRLLSHIVIGLQMIDTKLTTIKDFPAQQALLLKHLIVSHHGIREFGSPEMPKTLEAVLLHYIDDIDSKINGIRDFIASEDSGEAWTSFHRMLERQFYKGQ